MTTLTELEDRLHSIVFSNLDEADFAEIRRDARQWIFVEWTTDADRYTNDELARTEIVGPVHDALTGVWPAMATRVAVEGLAGREAVDFVAAAVLAHHADGDTLVINGERYAVRGGAVVPA